MLLSIIIPAHNEEENILDVITRIEKSVSIPHELLIVNDHSTDQTKKLLDELLTKYNNIRAIENKRDQGFANALKTGFANVKGDVVIPVMADLCDDLLVIEDLFSKIEQGYDIVCASRYSQGGARQGGSKLKGFLSSFAGRSLHYVLGIPTSDIANAFKMYRKKVLDSMVIVSKSFEISMEIPLKAYYSGFKITEIPTVWNERKKGKSSFRVFKLLPNYLKLYIWAVYKRLRG